MKPPRLPPKLLTLQKLGCDVLIRAVLSTIGRISLDWALDGQILSPVMNCLYQFYIFFLELVYHERSTEVNPLQIWSMDSAIHRSNLFLDVIVRPVRARFGRITLGWALDGERLISHHHHDASLLVQNNHIKFYILIVCT